MTTVSNGAKTLMSRDAMAEEVDAMKPLLKVGSAFYFGDTTLADRASARTPRRYSFRTRNKHAQAVREEHDSQHMLEVALG